MKIAPPPFRDLFPIETVRKITWARLPFSWQKWFDDLRDALSPKQLSSQLQAASKSAGVTLDQSLGNIVMDNASLAAGTPVTFTLTNNVITVSSIVIPSIQSGATIGAYALTTDEISDGSCKFTLYNRTIGALSEAVSFNFKVLNGTNI